MRRLSLAFVAVVLFLVCMVVPGKAQREQVKPGSGVKLPPGWYDIIVPKSRYGK